MLVNSASPDRNRIDGQKLVAAEIVEQFGSVPDAIALPFGGGGNVSAVSVGLTELGAAPALVVGEAAERPTTWATAIRIAEPAHADEVGGLVASGRLQIVTLSEDEIAHWWRRLSVEEGVFCEPASAAGVAALARIDRSAWQSAVAIVTGHGLKDTGAVDQSSSATVDATVEAILEALA